MPLAVFLLHTVWPLEGFFSVYSIISSRRPISGDYGLRHYIRQESIFGSFVNYKQAYIRDKTLVESEPISTTQSHVTGLNYVVLRIV